MKNAYDLSELTAKLHPRYPALGELDGKKKPLQLWHVFSSGNGRPPHLDPNPNIQICNVCGLMLSEEEIKQAWAELTEMYNRNKPVSITWPEPIFRALENRLETTFCPDRLPRFMNEVMYREGLDEPFDDQARSGLVLYGTVNDESFLRVDAVGLQKEETQEHLSDAEFNEWWWSLNDPSSDWAQKAHYVLQFVRERLKKQKQQKPKFILKNGKVVRSENQATLKVSDGFGGYYEVPDLRRRKASPSDEVLEASDEDVCSTCDCFKPCDCPPEETVDSTQESYSLECGCDQEGPSLACEAEGVWHVPAAEEDDGICDQCGAFKPCDHYSES